MKKSYILVIILFNIFIFHIIMAETLPFNPDLFSHAEKTQITPFEYYEEANILNIQGDLVKINAGEYLGIKTGFIYDIYHNGESVGQLYITFVSTEDSEAKITIKKGLIALGDKIKFSHTIDSYENLSYSKRYEKVLNGKVKMVEDTYCLIDLNSKTGLKLGMKFNILDDENNFIGLIETVDVSPDNDSVTNIIEKKSLIIKGQKIQQIPKEKKQWLELASTWEKTSETQEDAVYAYEQASKTSSQEEINEINNKLIQLTEKMIEEFNKKEEYYNSIIYLKKVKNVYKKYNESYTFLKNKLLESGKISWRTGNYSNAIKLLEQLEPNPEIIKLLSDSYNEVGQELEARGNISAGTYCAEKSLELNPNNITYTKNLYFIYELQKKYDKAVILLNRYKDLAKNDKEKKWVEANMDSLMRSIEYRAPNYKFIHTNEASFNLDSLQGYIIILFLWNTSYENIFEEMRYISNFYENYKDKQIKIIGINNDQKSTDEIKKFIKSNSITINFDIAFTTDKLDFIFPTMKIPQISILNKNGKLVYHKDGRFEEEEIKKNIENYLNE